MKTIMTTFIGMAAFLLATNVAQAANNCAGLAGTFKATFKIDTETYSNLFEIKNVYSDGSILGINVSGAPMIGLCRKGIVQLNDLYSDENKLLNSFYFVNGTQRFSIYNAAIYTDKIYSFSFLAEIKKISNSTNVSKLGKAAITPKELGNKKHQLLEKLYKQRKLRQ